MSSGLVEKIANAVLYEGYLLYPYRSSAVKNRQRWNFGVVYPRPYSEAQGGIEPCEMQTQCLALGGPLTSLEVHVRCLRLVERIVGQALPSAPPAGGADSQSAEPRLVSAFAGLSGSVAGSIVGQALPPALPVGPLSDLPADFESHFTPAQSVEVSGRTYESWQEAAECEFVLPTLHFAELAANPITRRFALEPTRTVEPLRDSSGNVVAAIVRTQMPLECSIEATIDQPQDGLFRIGIRISNQTPYTSSAPGREAVLAQSLLSAHTILQVHEGQFVSLLDPAPEYKSAAAACKNVGTWPVLAGAEDSRDTMLSSPIILYDYPQIAPDSPGDLFDGAEIDEILSLRILTLTDEEKVAMRRSDERAQQILDRTEALPPEHFMKMHGVLRALNPIDKEAS